ncbi:50S ribosomal protein L29 [Patescibacteria group bacterium]|nr:50S ribosomal protein L29 [Patescibacteria group bacterium]MBU1922184.1 50S ribosomal protein L29 [Patescibacteria group bacterium]
MELKELRKKNDQELKKMLAEGREKLRELKFKVSSRQYKAIRDIRKHGKQIARILTIQKERQKDIEKK